MTLEVPAVLTKLLESCLRTHRLLIQEGCDGQNRAFGQVRPTCKALELLRQVQHSAVNDLFSQSSSCTRWSTELFRRLHKLRMSDRSRRQRRSNNRPDMVALLRSGGLPSLRRHRARSRRNGYGPAAADDRRDPTSEADLYSRSAEPSTSQQCRRLPPESSTSPS